MIRQLARLTRLTEVHISLKDHFFDLINDQAELRMPQLTTIRTVRLVFLRLPIRLHKIARSLRYLFPSMTTLILDTDGYHPNRYQHFRRLIEPLGPQCTVRFLPYTYRRNPAPLYLHNHITIWR